MAGITINNKELAKHLEELKTEEIQQDLLGQVIRSSTDCKTRRDSYFASRRVVNRALYDKTQKHGVVKQYTKEEIQHMNDINKLTELHKLVYEVLATASTPVSASDVQSVLEAKHNQEFHIASVAYALNALVTKELAVKTSNGNRKFFAKAPEKAKIKIPKVAPEDISVSLTNIQDIILQWMVENNLLEFSINIRREK